MKVFTKFVQGLKKYPCKRVIFWALEEKEEINSCQVKVHFYNKDNELVHCETVCTSLHLLEDNVIKKLNKIKEKLFKSTNQ